MDDRMKKILDKHWAVVGFDCERALDIINNIKVECGKEVSKMKQNKNELQVDFTDGTTLRWVKASDTSRGQKFGKMWCDKTINRDIFNCVICPCYYGKREDIIWL